ncbi:MAG TPA: hypothetical protein VF009_01170 [Solirubrobacterales bacterium]
MNREATLTTVEGLLAEAQAELDRLTPTEAHAAARQGDLLIDIRPLEQRRRDGLVPGTTVVARNVLEWRLDPGGAHRDPDHLPLDSAPVNCRSVRL